MFLIDTHIWIWYALGNQQRLSGDTATRLQTWDEQGKLHLSVMSVWELGLLSAKDRVHLGRPVTEWVDTFFHRTHFQIIGLNSPVALNANQLPGHFHPDPVDRILVATARTQDLIMLTEDKKILSYAQQGYLSACSALQTQSLEI